MIKKQYKSKKITFSNLSSDSQRKTRTNLSLKKKSNPKKFAKIVEDRKKRLKEWRKWYG